MRRISEDTKIIGENLRNLRKYAGLSQRHLAENLDISPQQIQKYEAGTNRIPAEKLYRLGRFFDVPFMAFFKGLDQEGGKNDEDDKTQRLFRQLKHHKDRVLKKKIERVLEILLA